MTDFTRQHVRLATGTVDNDAQLIFVDGELVAVLAQLADWCHGQHRGRWLIKAGFGYCADGGPGLFDSPDDAETWVRRRLSR